MGKWIKENWFKTGIFSLTLICGSSVGYYYIFFLPSQLRSQEINRLTVECRNLGEKIEKKINPPDLLPGIIPAAPEFYYNPKLNKCFYCGGHDGVTEERFIMDVYTNQTITQYGIPRGNLQDFPKEHIEELYEAKKDFEKDKAELFRGNTFVPEEIKRWMKKAEENLKKFEATELSKINGYKF